VDARALAEALADPGLGLHRVKGIVRDRDGSGVVIQGKADSRGRKRRFRTLGDAASGPRAAPDMVGLS
jgi:hypothetical protein